VHELVERRLAKTSLLTEGKHILLFTYSISEAEDVQQFPSDLACGVEYGVWSKIENVAQIIEALSSYYLLFALGFGTDSNIKFSAWVEPYRFKSGEIMGTTVSVPVYDRTKTPHLFLGVVGVDLALDALNAALGTASDGNNDSEAIWRVATRSVARCPSFKLTKCELEAYRLATSGEAARCNSNCTSDGFIETHTKHCATVKNYPSDLFANTNLENQSYESRVCCAVGVDNSLSLKICSCSSSTSSPKGSGDEEQVLSAGAIAGIAIAVVLLGSCSVIGCCVVIGCIIEARGSEDCSMIRCWALVACFLLVTWNVTL
jgi:hypothetical protein